MDTPVDLDFVRDVLRRYDANELALGSAESLIFKHCVKYIVDTAESGQPIISIKGGTNRRDEPPAKSKVVDVRIEFSEEIEFLVISPPDIVFTVMNG